LDRPSDGAYRYETRTSTKIRPDHGSALRGPDSGMHTLMSFVGCVGTHIAESRLYEIMESTFGGVSKMLNGKKFPQNMRALRLVVEELLRLLFNTEDVTSYHDLKRVLEDVALESRTAKVNCLIRAVFIMMAYVRAE